ncbi:putative glycoprotein [Atrato Rhabdo-like virus 3]|uniref:Putative glycoprotein n=1 Tax=Atrato Rhabdo-like virus 3 TaxID=2689335 RepID=A0A6B9KNW3_9RHAB|nr:putative glycoprotein [Atrato Rhabdo-like virus 3]
MSLKLLHHIERGIGLLSCLVSNLLENRPEDLEKTKDKYKGLKVMFLLHLIIVVLAHEVAGTETQEMRIRVYHMTEWTQSAVPPPPLCTVRPLNHTNPIPTRLTIWHMIPHQQVGYGYIYSKYRLTTRCRMGLFGQQSHEILEKLPLASTVDEVLMQTSHPSLEAILDLTPDPAYRCVWMSSQDHASTRQQVQTVTLFLAENGCVLANNRVWCETSTRTVWSNGFDLMVADIQISQRCLYEPYRSLEGLMYPASQSAYVFLAPTGHYRVVVNLKNRVTSCESKVKELYTSDVGTPVSLNVSLTYPGRPHMSNNVPSISESNALRLSQEEYANQMNFQAVNAALQTLDAMICSNRLEQWTLAHRLKDANILAAYITKDPFAQGKQENSTFLIRVRASEDLVVLKTHIMVQGGNVIRLLYRGEWWYVAPTSGILSRDPPAASLLPPLLETPDGGMIDVKSGALKHFDWKTVGVNITAISPVIFEDQYTQDTVDNIINLEDRILTITWFPSLFSHHSMAVGVVVIFLISFCLVKNCGPRFLDSYCRWRLACRGPRRRDRGTSPPTPPRQEIVNDPPEEEEEREPAPPAEVFELQESGSEGSVSSVSTGSSDDQSERPLGRVLLRSPPKSQLGILDNALAKRSQAVALTTRHPLAFYRKTPRQVRLPRVPSSV